MSHMRYDPECPERRFFADGQEVTRDVAAWDIAPMRYLDGVLPASLTQPSEREKD